MDCKQLASSLGRHEAAAQKQLWAATGKDGSGLTIQDKLSQASHQMGQKDLLPFWPARAQRELYLGIPTFPTTQRYSMMLPSWRWGCAGRKGGGPFHLQSMEEADSNGWYFLKEIFFYGREPKRITCQEPALSFTIEENLFRESHFIEEKKKKMTSKHLKYLDL